MILMNSNAKNMSGRQPHRASAVPAPYLAVATLALVTACGGGGDPLPATPPPPTAQTFTVAGTVSGLRLRVGGPVLRNNGADDITVLGDGAFSFGTALSAGSPTT